MKNETFDRISKGFRGIKSDIENVFDYNGANYIMEKYAFALPVVSKSKYNEFAEVFCRLAHKSDEINFHSLWVITAKRSGIGQISDRDLFDDIKTRPNNIDKKALNNLIGIMGKSVKYNDYPSAKFLNKFTDFITEKVKYYSFKDKEIAQMQEVLSEEYHNKRISESFLDIASKVETIHKNKRSNNIKLLNDWAYKYNLKSDDLIKQLSFRSTYINLLYESVIKENDIDNINIQDYYLQHRMKVQKNVAELTGTTDTTGKIIVRKYAINKVYKAIGSQDKFKHNALIHSLEKHQDQPFYNDAKNILVALDGGKKNREIQKPIKKPTYQR